MGFSSSENYGDAGLDFFESNTPSLLGVLE